MDTATQPDLLSTALYFSEAGSDKEYHANIAPSADGFVVNFSYGRRGGSLVAGTKTSQPVGYAEAVKVYDKLVKEKMAKGYTPATSGVAFSMTDKAGQISGEAVQLLNAIDEDYATKLINDDRFCLEQKYDGVRLRSNNIGTPEGSNRKGLIVSLLSEIDSELAAQTHKVKVDGEQVGNIYFVFDILSFDGKDLSNLPYSERCKYRNQLVWGANVENVKSYIGTSEKRMAYSLLKSMGAEGAVFKELSAPYKAGRPNSGGSQLKCKFWDSCSAVVSKVNAQRSVALELDGIGVGNVTISPNFDVPKQGDVVEVRYLYAYRGGSLYQPTFLGVRSDIDACECKMSQLKYKNEGGDSDDGG